MTSKNDVQIYKSYVDKNNVCIKNIFTVILSPPELLDRFCSFFFQSTHQKEEYRLNENAKNLIYKRRRRYSPKVIHIKNSLSNFFCCD